MMDIDKRNRFQVNRVDSNLNFQGSPNNGTEGTFNTATLVGYTSAEERRVSSSEGNSPVKLMSPHRLSVVDPAHFTLSGNYDTKHARSFHHFTKEALPRMDNYRNMMSIQAAYRPTLDELHDVTHRGETPDPKDGMKKEGGGSGLNFGWVKGVFVRCLLNIWGVMLFLRLSWITGHAGIGQAWVIILVATAVTGICGISMSAISTNGQIRAGEAMLIILSASLVTLLTSLSTAAICTNGEIKAGGTYYMISRSLGPEFGASIGLIFAAANAVAAAMYCVGFSESMVDLLKSLDTYIVPDQTNSIRVVGTVTIIVCICIIMIGMEWEASAQVGLLIILLAAIADFIIGSIVGPLDDEEYSKGFVGYNGSVLLENLMPNYRETKDGMQSFFSVFSIFFPAATGFLAGANISGDLEDPQDAIPRGTLLSIFVTTISYLAFTLIAGAVVVRDATGNFTLPDHLVNASWQERKDYISETFQNCDSAILHADRATGNGTGDRFMCEWGLMNSFQVMELVAVWGPLIYAGCFAATLSSALASLVSAPKVFQALCNDQLYPYLEFFGKGYGKNNEPIRGYVLTFLIALAFILIAELNAIAPLISNFFLAAYALVNFSTFHVSLVKPVGWRPTFKYYNPWLSLAGGLLCVAVMFLISWGTALITFVVIFFLYMIVVYRKPEVNWGSSTQAQTYKMALSSVQQLNNVPDHVKNFRPQILVLSGVPSQRPTILDFAYLITKQISLLVCGNIVKGPLNSVQRKAMLVKGQQWLKVNKVKAFFSLVDDMSFEEGAKALLQASGVGRLRPNILLLGYKNNWSTCNAEDLNAYFNTIHKAFDMQLAVTILRVAGGLDFSNRITFGEDHSNSNEKNNLSSCEFNQSFSQISQASMGEAGKQNTDDKKNPSKRDPQLIYRNLNGGEISREVGNNLTRFQKKYKQGTIDVWWLYDDGGLTLLLPYIISTRANWATCKLRVFALANKRDEFESEHRSMAGLLSKFRIDYSDLKIINDYTSKPQDQTRNLFEGFIAPFRRRDNRCNENEEGSVITETDLITAKDKCARYMRLRELLQENSRCSDLVVMTMPMPKKGITPAPLYMSWLEILTRDMPPFLFVRGNQTSVLTFYS